MAEDQVHRDHRIDDEEPHHHVMPLADGEVAAHQGDDPGEEVGKPGFAHGCLHAEAGDRLEQEDQKGEHVRETGEAVMSMLPLEKRETRWMTFRSSRTFPGHG